MGDGDFSEQDLQKLKWIMNDPNADPTLKKTIQMYEHFSQLSKRPENSQEETDRRWSIMVEAEGKIPKDEKPKTMGAFRDLLLRYGFTLATPVPVVNESDKANFGVFMETYGNAGMSMMKDYEMKSAPNARPVCDECGKDAGLRCKVCGERYCSKACQRKGWPEHKKICSLFGSARN